MRSGRVVLPFVLFSVLSPCASAQSIVSAHSGVIHYSEGSVFIDDRRVEQKLGRFSEIKQGSLLRTEDGRAEVLLTPGMVLRLGEASAMRMISNRLTDTRVEIVAGSAVLEFAKAAPGTSVVITCRTSEVRFHTPGLYRFNSEPPELRVEEGEAEVLSDGRSVTVKQGQTLPFSGAAAAPQPATNADDALDSWARKRSVSVAASDAANAQAEDMAVLLDPQPVDLYSLVPSYVVFPYIPMIGGYGFTRLGPWASPFYLPRIRPYSYPTYSGYNGYRSGYHSGYRPLSPIRIGTQVPFRPPMRVYGPAAGSRPVTVSPAPPNAGGVRGGGHR